MRQLFAWAISPEYGYARNNPACDVTRLRGTNPVGIPAWTEHDALRYEARHPLGTKERLAFDLLFTGVRRSDVVRLGPQMERWFTETLPDGNRVEVQKLVFTETKGGSRIVKTHELPILPPLRESKPSAIGSRSDAVRPVLRISARMACASSQRCAEAGATEHQLMALFGWTNPQQAALYTKKANRAKLEAQAAALLQAQTSNKSVPLLPEVASSGAIRSKKGRPKQV